METIITILKNKTFLWQGHKKIKQPTATKNYQPKLTDKIIACRTNPPEPTQWTPKVDVFLQVEKYPHIRVARM